MSSFVYNSARTTLATGALDWVALPVNAMLVNANYSASPGDLYVSSILPGAIVVRDLALTQLAHANNLFSGVIPEILALLDSVPTLALILYVKRATDAVSELLYYSSDGVGFPFTPRGFNYAVGYNQLLGGFIGIFASQFPVPNLLTSQPYPVVVSENMSLIEAGATSGFLLLDLITPRPENVTLGVAILSGDMHLGLLTYSNALPENMSVNQVVLTSGTLGGGIKVYTGKPENMTLSEVALTGGDMHLGLITYSQAKPENISVNQVTLTGGTLI